MHYIIKLMYATRPSRSRGRAGLDPTVAGAPLG